VNLKEVGYRVEEVSRWDGFVEKVGFEPGVKE